MLYNFLDVVGPLSWLRQVLSRCELRLEPMLELHVDDPRSFTNMGLEAILEASRRRSSNSTSTILETVPGLRVLVAAEGDSFMHRSIFYFMIVGSIPIFFFWQQFMRRLVFAKHNNGLKGMKYAFDVAIESVLKWFKEQEQPGWRLCGNEELILMGKQLQGRRWRIFLYIFLQKYLNSWWTKTQPHKWRRLDFLD